MKTVLSLVFAALITTSATAEQSVEPAEKPLFVPADMTDLSEFLWQKRPVLVFADSEFDPAFVEQIDLLHKREPALIERDVIILTDTNPESRNPLRLKMRPRGFMLVLVGKDGKVKLRKPFPWSVREITRSIDKMPIRQREIRDENARKNASSP